MSAKEDKKDEVVTLAEEVKSLFAGAEVSDELQTKITTVLETVIAGKVRETETALTEEFEVKLAEAVAADHSEIDETVNGYLDYVVSEWMDENKIAVEAGIRTEMTEGFIEGMKELFEQNYVSIPTDKTDAYSKATARVEELEGKLSESITDSAALKSEIEAYQRKQVIEAIGTGLADTQMEKLATLVEGIVFGDKETFTKKVETVRESFFKKDETADKKDLTEDNRGQQTDSMARYVKALSR